MKIGILSDTHKDKMNALEHIIFNEFIPRGAELIIHCGDIEPEHLYPELFGNMSVICALTDEQVDKCARGDEIAFYQAPQGWVFTKPDERIIDLYGFIAYVGHKRAYDFLKNSWIEIRKTMHEIRKNHNNVRWMFSGHTHHQIFLESPLISFINPGAVEGSFGAAGGHQFAFIDTAIDRVIFSRILGTQPIKEELIIGVISDSFDVSLMDVDFWGKLASEFNHFGVSHIIHCGNISLQDIGREELSNFQVYYQLREDQKSEHNKSIKENLPSNWHTISNDRPIVDINGYRFCVQLLLGPKLFKQSEIDINRTAMRLQLDYPETDFVLCGNIRNAFLEEAQNLIILNPGDAVQNKNYAVIELPRKEITFGKVQNEPLKKLVR